MFIPKILKKYIDDDSFIYPYDIPTQDLYFNKINQDFLFNQVNSTKTDVRELFMNKRFFKYDKTSFVRDLHNANVEMYKIVTEVIDEQPKDYYFNGSWDPAAIFKIRNEKLNKSYTDNYEIILDPDVRQPGNVYNGTYPFWQKGTKKYIERTDFDYENDRRVYSPKKIWDFSEPEKAKKSFWNFELPQWLKNYF